ncbi:hypothetical protein STRAU_1474 [Streptomyces aurantiacus JA 4570]|uniref:Uncharacterized protein n=1 Tax=Streptomyces aurantiacus JA 4570 TaxID=1286094 RepID=S4AVM8_9ACTN|nr:hypothetical protein STRAU_1474 [Streptomyces aurantiacus JA 4570]
MAERAQAGAGPRAGAVAVELPRPRRAWPGKADRADQRDERHDHPDQGRAQLALGQRDHGEAAVQGDVQGERDAVVAVVRGEFVDAERAEAGEDQHDQGRREDDDLHALAALLAPVDVVQVQDQGELVQDQARAQAEDDRRAHRPEAVPSRGDRPEAADQHQEDARHDVVDVDVARRDVAERALPGADEARDGPGDQEGPHEGGKGEQQRQLPRLHDFAVPPVVHGPVPSFVMGPSSRS